MKRILSVLMTMTMLGGGTLAAAEGRSITAETQVTKWGQMPVRFTVGIKPTPSIALPQQTVSLPDGTDTTLEIKGRHDPCIAQRAVPVIEAAAALTALDVLLDDCGKI